MTPPLVSVRVMFPVPAWSEPVPPRLPLAALPAVIVIAPLLVNTPVVPIKSPSASVTVRVLPAPVMLATIVVTLVWNDDVFLAATFSTLPVIVPLTLMLPAVAPSVTLAVEALTGPDVVRLPVVRLTVMSPALVAMLSTFSELYSWMFAAWPAPVSVRLRFATLVLSDVALTAETLRTLPVTWLATVLRTTPFAVVLIVTLPTDPAFTRPLPLLLKRPASWKLIAPLFVVTLPAAIVRASSSVTVRL